MISGVSISEKYGLGLPDTKPILKVFLPFFIQANLPYHIKRGEVLMQDFIIFNYLSKNQSVIVSVKRDDQRFEVLDPALDGWTSKLKLKIKLYLLSLSSHESFAVADDKYLQNFTSVTNQPSGLRIVIRPKVLGFIDIFVSVCLAFVYRVNEISFSRLMPSELWPETAF